MKVNGVILKSLLASAITLACSSAFAGTVTIGSATAPVDGSATIPVSFAADAGDDTASIACQIVTPPGLTVTAAAAVPGQGTLCAHNAAQGYVLVSVAMDDNSVPADGVKCNITYSIDAGANEGDIFDLIPDRDVANLGGEGECRFGNAVPAEIPGNVVAGAITVLNQGPLSVDIDETPIAFGAGTTGTPATDTFVGTIVDAVGGDGTETASVACVATPAGLSVSPASVNGIESGDADITFTVNWTYGAALNGNVTCTVTDSDGNDDVFVVPVTAPAGTDGAPALSAAPAAPGPINVPSGAPGNQTCTNISISAAGGAGVAEVATATCVSADPAVVVNNGGPLNFAPGAGPQNVQVCVTLTDAAQDFAAAVTCDIDDANGLAQWDFNVAAPAGQNAPVFVPASSLWSKLALFGIFAVLGGLVLGLRRQH